MATGWGRRVREQMQRIAVGLSATPETLPQYLALLTVQSLDGGGGNNNPRTTEPSGTNGYTRPMVTWNPPATYTGVTLDASNVVTNNGTISWTSTGGGFSTAAANFIQIAIYTTNTIGSTAE